MRRKALSFGVLVLPAASALSLANFQLITSDSLPISCELAYDSTIPGCTTDDFNDGCSETCTSGLNMVSANVDRACSGITVNSKSLLGIVMSGQVVEALCPNGNAATTSKPPAQGQPIVVSVTIPTDSRGVTGGLGFETTSTTPIVSVSKTTPVTVPTSATPVPVQSTIATTSRSVISTTQITQTSSTPTPTTVVTEGTGVGVFPPAATTTTSETTSSKATAAATPKPDRGSGGGSPFDINSNSGASGNELESICGKMVGMFWVGMLLVR